VSAGGLDAGMWSLFLTGGAGILLIIVGTLALLLQRIVQQDGRTEVQLPFGVRLSTNYPALVLALVGAFLAGLPYYTHEKCQSMTPDRIPIAGQVGAESTDIRGDLFLGITERIVPVGDISHEDKEVRLEALKLPSANGYMVLGIAQWDDGKQDVGYASVTGGDGQNPPTFKLRIRRRP
jgi:hypothetical protein